MKEFGTAIVLAGGNSSRMGFDKQQLVLHNDRLIRQIVETLTGTFEQIILVTKTPELYHGLPVTTATDIIQGMGPLGGIHAGLIAAESRCAFVIACDMPGINKEYIAFMMESMKKAPFEACVTRFGEWIEPFHGFYAKELTDELEAFLKLGRKSVYKFLEGQKTLYIPEEEARKFSPDWDMFFNLNTREDLADYLTRTKESS